MTPREFSLVIKAENERRYDMYEMYSVQALMIRKATLTKPNKRMKPEDIFKRPTENSKYENKIIDMQEKIKEQERFMNKLTFKPKGESEQKWQKKV